MLPYRNAAGHPFALTVLLAAVVAGVMLDPWLLPLGLLLYALIVVVVVRQAARSTTSQDPLRPGLTSSLLSQQVALIERAHQAIARSVAQAEGPVGRLLERISSQTAELLEQTYSLSAKGQVIETYLAQVDLAELQQRLSTLDRQLAATADAYTMQQLQATRATLAEKQRNYAALTTYLGRIQAQLQHIHATLDNVLAETIRLRTADAVSADSATNQVAQRLSDLRGDMDAFQRALDTALAGAGAT
ncbi:MAG: hypothetical protein AB4911_19085 [Oscillochloridaceae bacterium umkhey_bin13]